MRIILAFQAFFAILFTGKAPLKALPPPPEPKPDEAEAKRKALAKELDEARVELKQLKGAEKALRQEHEALQAEHKAASEKLATLEGDSEGHAAEVESAKELAAKEAEAAKAELAKERDAAHGALKDAQAELEQAKAEVSEKAKRLEELKQSAESAGEKLKQARDDGALALLAWLQREGRLIDFLRESIDDYEDEQIGAAVRAIHSGCRKVLDEALKLEPVLAGDENEPVEVPKGFDPVAISLSGNVKGDPPFKGTLMHHGWRTETVSVPVPETVDPRVLAPAEVEL